MGNKFIVTLFMFGAVISLVSNIGPPSGPSGAEFKGSSGTSPDYSAEADSASEETAVSYGETRLRRSYDGHFYADVEINGQRIHALVDTGASIIALTREDARRAGLATSISMPNVIGEGAGGAVRGDPVMLDRVAMGSVTAESLPAVILDSGSQTLLGQSFLSKFASVEIRGDEMILR